MVLALMLVTSTAFAATITINQPTPTDGTAGAESYSLYKIFDVTKTSDVTEPVTGTIGAGTAKGFSYTISTSNPWFAKLGTVSGTTWTAASGQTWVTLTPSAGDSTKYNVTWAGANTEDAAKAFADWLLANKGEIAADKTMESNGTAATAEVSDGYWLITSTLGTNLVLATSNITINTKNEYVTDEKAVAKTNYNVGDQVEYTITVNLPASIDYTKPVIVHDTMDNVLALTESSVSAKIGEDNFTGIQLVKSDAFGTDHDSTHTGTDKVLFDFVLDISSLAPAANADPVAKTIVITYTAELLSTAAADTDYVNKEFTEYSKYKTNPNEVKVKTYDFDLEKTFTGSNDTTLEATFNLYASASGTKAASPLELVEETKYEKYVKADSNDQTKTTTITAKLGTTLNVRGLAEGTYYLTELTTAPGYNRLTEDIVIEIDAAGNATVSGNHDLFSASGDKITVVNNTGSVLPSTGGIGTTIFYIAGLVLVLGAAAIVIARRKAEQ
jgi:fimbrial isopeptide formation D2 family protein/LPXTG-motif cell wall-anchored protein